MNTRSTDAQHTVVLTGATGFVGGQLLMALLNRDRRRIACLVRASDAVQAQQRGAARLRELCGQAPSPETVRRIDWIQSDMEQPLLGMRMSDWQALAARTQQIFHCAASVEFDLPLPIARRINVDGVRNMLALARAAGSDFDRLHHVSTAYVAGRTHKRVGPDHLPRDTARRFRNTYEQTKAEAERVLRTQADVAVTIYRPSIIAGHTQTGATSNWNVLYVPIRNIFDRRLPCVPHARNAVLDTVAIDYVVDGIVALSTVQKQRVQAFHLTADRLAFTVAHTVHMCHKVARERGLRIDTRLVGWMRWFVQLAVIYLMSWAPGWLGRYKKRGQIARRGLRALRPFLSYLSVRTEFDAVWEHGFLERCGIGMPPPDAYLDRVITYAVEQSFGRGPVTRVTPESNDVRLHVPASRPMSFTATS